MMLTQDKNKNDIVLTIILIISVILGFLIRIKGLGKWPVAVDEYYIIESAKNILKHGLPEFHYGGFYDRGLIYQYLVSGLLLFGFKPEFAGRIIPAVANILTVQPLYLLAKKISGKKLAVALTVVFCFSVWEVEFARFARMYSPFQLIFVWYIYFLYKTLFENDQKSVKWLFILSFISVFVFEGSIFLVILNFLPFLWNRDEKTFDIKKISIKEVGFNRLFFASIIFIIAIVYLRTDFRDMGVNNLPPSNVTFPEESTGGVFRHPVCLLFTLPSNFIWLIFFILPLLLSLFAAYKLLKNENITTEEKLSVFILIALSILNLFGLSVLLLVIFIMLGWVQIKRLKSFKAAGAVITLNYLFWTLFAVFTTQWHKYFTDIQITGAKESIKVIWKKFIDYPYIYETFHLFYSTLPHLTLMVVLLLGLGVFLLKKIEQKLLFFLFTFLLLITLFLNLTYFDTRYFFFLYPLILLLILSIVEIIAAKISSNNLVSTVSFTILIIGFLFISEDFNINHLYNIDSKAINFRENFSFAQKIHYYPRWDTRAPAEVINRNLNDSDIVITNKQMNDFYLKKLNYIYIDYRESDFPGIFVDNGKKERWTNANLIYDDKSLINLLKDKDSTKWLIINTMWGTGFLKQDHFFKEFSKYAIYSNDDSSAIVYKIPPHPVIN
jgi:hypothetical protein